MKNCLYLTNNIIAAAFDIEQKTNWTKVKTFKFKNENENITVKGGRFNTESLRCIDCMYIDNYFYEKMGGREREYVRDYIAASRFELVECEFDHLTKMEIKR